MTFTIYVGVFVEMIWFPSCCCFVIYAEFNPVEMPARTAEMLVVDTRRRVDGYRSPLPRRNPPRP